MNIRLLGNESNFNSSPKRSVYRLTKDSNTQEYTFIVPLDIWYLERDRAGSVKDAGKRRRTPSSWKEFELGTAGGTGIAKLLGKPPK